MKQKLILSFADPAMTKRRRLKQAIFAPRHRTAAVLITAVAVCILLVTIESGQCFRSRLVSGATPISNNNDIHSSFINDDRMLTDFGFAAEKAWAVIGNVKFSHFALARVRL